MAIVYGGGEGEERERQRQRQMVIRGSEEDWPQRSSM